MPTILHLCVPCAVEYKIYKNGVIVHAFSDGKYYFSSEADEWKCPKCRHLMLTGFGTNPLNFASQKPYEEFVESIKSWNKDSIKVDV